MASLGTAEVVRSPKLPILAAHADPVAFDRVLGDPAMAAIELHPHTGAFGRAYHPAIHGNRDLSFAVYVDDVVALVCLCAPLDGALGFYGMPLKLIASPTLGDVGWGVAVQSAFENLDELARANGLSEISILDDRPKPTSAIEKACRIRGATMATHQVAFVDLTAGPAAWRKALRKSSRSLINWGRRNLSIGWVNKEIPDRIQFDRYRAFHAEIAGRVTRTDESWNVMYEWILKGGGELILAFLAGRLVAGSLFIDGTQSSIYASAVYDRSQFDKPLAHYPVWLGIERAQARGMKMLELGEVPMPGVKSEKEYQIGYFKRGFATHIETQALWRWPVGS